MKSTLYNLGPMLGVLGVVAWMCWPHVVNYGSSPPYRGGEKLVRIEKKQLEPQIPSASKRNPFQPVSPDQAADDEVLEPEVDWQKIAQSLTLSGTSRGSGKRCVLINGQVYAEGSQIPTPVAGVFCKVLRVLEDGVVLDAGDRQIRLTYASATLLGPRKLGKTLSDIGSESGSEPSGLMKWLMGTRSLRTGSPAHTSHPTGMQDVGKPATDRPLEQ